MDRFVYTSMTDPRAAADRGAVGDYIRFYGQEYGEHAVLEMRRYHAERFMAPEGAFLLLQRGRRDHRRRRVQMIWAGYGHGGVQAHLGA